VTPAQLKLGKKSLWLRILGTGLSVGLLIYLLVNQGWDEIGSTITEISWWRFGIALVLILISRIAVSLRWFVLLRFAKVPISFRQSLEITFGGLFASNFLPTTIGGDVFRLIGMLEFKLDSAICTASLIVDRLVGMTGMAMVLPLNIPLIPLLNKINFLSILKIGYFSTIWKNNKNTVLSSWWFAIKQFLKNILDAVSIWLSHPESLLFSLSWNLVHQLALFECISLFLGGLHNPLPYWQIAGLYSLTYFITQLPISINGYGVQEIALTFIFTTAGNVTTTASLTLAILIRIIIMLASLPGAFFIPKLIAGKTINNY
jgi:uncharacterized protein (TIRG00374 family)